MSGVGPLTIERERLLRSRGIRCRVFWRGEDVTSRCRYADDTPGGEVAVLYRKTEDGRFHRDEGGEVAVQIAEGDVLIVREPVLREAIEP